MILPFNDVGAYVVMRNLTGHTIEPGEWVFTQHKKVILDKHDQGIFHHVDASADEYVDHGKYGRFRLKKATFL